MCSTFYCVADVAGVPVISGISAVADFPAIYGVPAVVSVFTAVLCLPSLLKSVKGFLLLLAVAVQVPLRSQKSTMHNCVIPGGTMFVSKFVRTTVGAKVERVYYLSAVNMTYLPRGLTPQYQQRSLFTLQHLLPCLKGHGNEADFPRFLHKSVRNWSLTLHFETFQFWLRIRRDTVFIIEKLIVNSESRGLPDSESRLLNV